jgi:hypothetical protein
MSGSFQSVPPNVLFYSAHCAHSRYIIDSIRGDSRKPILPIRYACVDNIRRAPTGENVIVLPNGAQMPLPPEITSVPSLMIPTEHNRIVTGKDILEQIYPKKIQDLTYSGMEGRSGPLPFSMGGPKGGFRGASRGGSVVSDSFSFLSRTADEMATNGGGAKQMFHYTPVGHRPTLFVSDAEYNGTTEKDPESAKKLNVSLDEIIQARERDIPKMPPRR